MKRFIQLFSAIILLGTLSACVSGGSGMIIVTTPALKKAGFKVKSPIRSDREQGGCIVEDFEATVTGGKHCLILDVYKSEKISKSPTLAVFVHGDGENGTERWADLIESNITYDKAFMSGNYVLVSIMRPGFKNWRGQSSGYRNPYGSRSYTLENITSVMNAVEKLAKHYKANKVLAFGSSGGAATLGAGIGLYPNTPINEVILVGCPCEISSWQASHGWKVTGNSVPAISVVNNVRKDIVITALTGDKDNNTWPHLAKDYVSKAKKHGLNATFISIEDGTHKNSRWKKQFTDFFKKKLLNPKLEQAKMN